MKGWMCCVSCVAYNHFNNAYDCARLDVLARQKEQQLRDLVALRDEREEVAERNEDTRLRMKEAQQKSFQLLQR